MRGGEESHIGGEGRGMREREGRRHECVREGKRARSKVREEVYVRGGR